MQSWPKAVLPFLLPPAGEGGAQCQMRGAFRLHREERPHLPSGHPLPLAGEAIASNAAICQARHSSPRAAMQALLPPAGEGGAQCRMRGAFRLHREERPHLPSGHPLPQAGEATASNAAICQARHSSPRAAMQALLPPAGEGGAQRRMRGASGLYRAKHPLLPFGHLPPPAREEQRLPYPRNPHDELP